MITGVFGQTGTGKTTLLKRVVARTPRVIVIDPLGKLGHLGRCVGSLSAFKNFWRQRFSSEWRMVLQPAKIAPRLPPREALAPFVKTAFEVAAGGCPPFLVAVDEADAFGTPGNPDPVLRMIADYGRNYGVSLLFVARRPACVDRTLTANAGTLYIYRITEARDLEYFKGVIGGPCLARLPTLDTFHALRWQGSDVDTKVVEIPPVGGRPASPPAVETPERIQRAAPTISESDPWAGESVVISLGELCRAHGFSNTTKFRETVLERGVIPCKRISPRRYRIPVASLPST